MLPIHRSIVVLRFWFQKIFVFLYNNFEDDINLSNRSLDCCDCITNDVWTTLHSRNGHSQSLNDSALIQLRSYPSIQSQSLPLTTMQYFISCPQRLYPSYVSGNLQSAQYKSRRWANFSTTLQNLLVFRRLLQYQQAAVLEDIYTQLVQKYLLDEFNTTNAIPLGTS